MSLTLCLNCTELLHTNECNEQPQTNNVLSRLSCQVPVRRLIASGPQRATRIT